jgi:hypothetical protein
MWSHSDQNCFKSLVAGSPKSRWECFQCKNTLLNPAGMLVCLSVPEQFPTTDKPEAIIPACSKSGKNRCLEISKLQAGLNLKQKYVLVPEHEKQQKDLLFHDKKQT